MILTSITRYCVIHFPGRDASIPLPLDLWKSYEELLREHVKTYIVSVQSSPPNPFFHVHIVLPYIRMKARVDFRMAHESLKKAADSRNPPPPAKKLSIDQIQKPSSRRIRRKIFFFPFIFPWSLSSLASLRTRAAVNDRCPSVPSRPPQYIPQKHTAG